MTSRRQHLMEMRHALAHNVSLNEARRQLARLRWQATENVRTTLSAPPAARPKLIMPEKRHFWWNAD
jgi:hypothetical protein